MKREATADDSWEVLNCPGANGIFLVVLGAVWWFNALKGKSSKELEELLDDVQWAMERMTSQENGAVSRLGKRPNPPTVLKDKRGKKRARKS